MTQEWWHGAVIYQVYPRSFQDSNNDGIGDLPGLTARLDHIASLGVDGIWICPFYPSPMKDFGYDVSDYRNVDPLFGTLDDFDVLLKKAHSFGLKIIIDLVLSHTSEQHPWFSDPAKKDWYVWADGKPDDGLPNNWVSVFGGPAWTYDDRYGQYYLHNFLKEQPDLNFHNPQVQAEVLDICRFWLERGVDGFRLDVVNFYFHDQELRDNPVRASFIPATQFEGDAPYSRQQHIYDKSQPENLEFIKKLRQVTDQYPDTFTIGEIGDDDPYARTIEYTSGAALLHTAYNTMMMSGTSKMLTEDIIRKPVEPFMNRPGLDKTKAWPSWAFSNHDVVRAASRWYSEPFGHDQRLSKMLIALLGCLPGTVFLYQGEELGLPEAQIPFEKIQDPWAKETYPLWQGRDGCRTPMPWDSSASYCGFSDHEPWLPIPQTHFHLCVQSQKNNHNSCWVFTQKFLLWRKNNIVLVKGDCSFHLTGNSNILDFARSSGVNATRCIFNLSADDQIYDEHKIPPYGFIIEGFGDA